MSWKLPEQTIMKDCLLLSMDYSQIQIMPYKCMLPMPKAIAKQHRVYTFLLKVGLCLSWGLMLLFFCDLFCFCGSYSYLLWPSSHNYKKHRNRWHVSSHKISIHWYIYRYTDILSTHYDILVDHSIIHSKCLYRSIGALLYFIVAAVFLSMQRWYFGRPQYNTK